MHQTEHIGLYINIASHQIRRTADGFSARYGLTGIQSRILSYIGNTPEKEIYQKDIEKHFGIRRSSVTSVITNLEQNGFLRRQAVPGDARLKKLVLTENGVKVNREMSRAILEFEQSLSDCFSEKEQHELIDMLKRIIEKLCYSCDRRSEIKLNQRKDEIIC